MLRVRPRPAFARQRLELPDGDFLDLDWGLATQAESPLVMILHGLEGSARSSYVRSLAHHLGVAGWQSLVMHFRGCSGAPNRLARSYHSGETSDLDRVVRWLRRQWPHRPLAVVGYSLGGNVLLKWLGEHGVGAPVDAAVAVCVPMELAVSARRLDQGLSRVYRWRLVRDLRRKVLAKFRYRPGALDLTRVSEARGFREFDDAVTAPLHGFDGVDHYYRDSSARRFLAAIRRPTLIVHALDDPFMTPEVLPAPGSVPIGVRLEVSRHGGHVGFVAGGGPLGLLPRYWLDTRISAYLNERLAR